ncbi:V-type sodium ATP synthase subunit E [Tetragenococcus halophilus]|uniref:V-type Na(+)-transporting ATPase subunit E n=1 Tax=Tetragenococcus halophilus subsp. halophilus TaxID=1513897 RepID=A0A2H6CR83_TETHA|nr:hypothetical protein [Tetragenococcus halophilus]GBD67491.1 hypothetical protein TEHN7118_0297 [Tetragenococcus halophilus subsp. halophilus]GMG62011.1 V-type sodium ATP synthase subunit E [Tetragenococcus halophilus]
MDAIETIIQDIDQQAEDKRVTQKNERIKEIDQSFATEKQKIDKTHEEQLATQKQRLRKNFRQEKNRNVVQSRQKRLKRKQQYLDQIFEDAYDEMAHWDIEKTRDFLLTSLKENGLTKGKIIPAGKTEASVYSPEWIKQVNQRENMELSLGEKSSNQEHGFLIEVSGVQYNFYYHELLAEVKKSNSSEIMQNLFT